MLPIAALALAPIASLSRIVRVEGLKVLDQDYIRTARGKRLPARLVYVRHALPNTLTPTLTMAGLLLGGLLAGTVLVENIFAWPGLGTTLVNSVTAKDYPTVQAVAVVFGAVVLLVNFAVDLAARVHRPAVDDPRLVSEPPLRALARLSDAGRRHRGDDRSRRSSCSRSSRRSSGRTRHRGSTS